MSAASFSRIRSYIGRFGGNSGRARRTSLGQGMVELALVTPILLLIFAAAADFGRAYFSFVAIENAAKEGAFVGSRNPLCDDSSTAGCSDPNNVLWIVQNELAGQNIVDQNGDPLTPTVACVDHLTGNAWADLDDCAEGDTYEVTVVHPFQTLTPMLGSIIGNLNLSSTARAVVLNEAFDPSPGASIQKLVSPVGATNEADIVANCVEPEPVDAPGFFRSPCLNETTTNDQNDTLKVTFESGVTINYRITISNSGAQTLTGVTVIDSQGSTGCLFPATIAVGATPTVCNYARTAPTPSGAAITMDYTNTATIASAQTTPVSDFVTAKVDKPPARLRVMKWVSPFALGADGDGTPTFGTLDDLTISHSTLVPSPFVWYKVVVQNNGGQPATGLSITDTNGPLPFNLDNANADCDANVSTLAENATWTCLYRVAYSSSSPAQVENTATATAANVTPDGDDSHSATVHINACTGSNRVIPNLVRFKNSLGATSANDAQTKWSDAGFTGTLTDVDGQNNGDVEHQTIRAFECRPATSTMSFGNNPS